MSNNSTFNIDDLLKMPKVADEFNKTNKINLDNDPTIPFKDESKVDSINAQMPPPIIPKVNKEIINDINLNEQQIQNPSSHEKIVPKNTNKFLNSFTNAMTRILFDDEDEPNTNQNVNIDSPVLNKSDNSGSVKEVNIVEEKIIEKNIDQQINFKTELKKLPGFFRFEYKHALASLIIAFILIFLNIITISVASWAVFGISFCSEWIYLPQGLFTLFSGIFLVTSLIKVKTIKKELKNNDYLLSKDKIFTSLTKIYKSLVVSNIYLNWISLSTYVVSGLLILLTFIVTYFTNLSYNGENNFGNLFLYGGVDKSAFIVVWTFAAFSFFMMLLQIIYNPLNIYRKNQLELYYGKTLISEELIEKCKKTANKRGMIIFFSSVIMISFIVVITYFVLRRKTKK